MASGSYIRSVPGFSPGYVPTPGGTNFITPPTSGTNRRSPTSELDVVQPLGGLLERWETDEKR